MDKRQNPTPTYEISLPPIFTPLPSKTVTTPYIPINGFTTSIRSYAPISENTEIAATPTKPAVYLPSYSPISRSHVPASLLDLPTPSPSPSPIAITENKQSLSGGKIAGIVVGATIGLLLACYAIYVLCWSRRNIVKKSQRKNDKKKSSAEKKDYLEKKSKPSGNSVDIDQVIMEELDEEQKISGDLEKNGVFSKEDENQPITFPRFGKYYDPKRRYSPTSPNSDLREDFRSYYKARALERGSSSSGSSSSASSDPPLPFGQVPFYGEFNPYYGPMMQRQTPAIYPYSNYNLPMYTPQLMLLLQSSMPKASTPGMDYSI